MRKLKRSRRHCPNYWTTFYCHWRKTTVSIWSANWWNCSTAFLTVCVLYYSYSQLYTHDTFDFPIQRLSHTKKIFPQFYRLLFSLENHFQQIFQQINFLFVFAIINLLWYFRQCMSYRLLLLKGTSAERKSLFWSYDLLNLFTNFSPNLVGRYMYVWKKLYIAGLQEPPFLIWG